MSSSVTYHPWSRRGLSAQLVADTDAYGLPIGGVAQIRAEVNVQGIAPVDRTLTLAGPDAVTGLAPGQILRRYPEAGAGDVSPGFFPLIEFSDPALPWFLTPAAPTDDDRLAPWLALIALPVEAGATISRRPGHLLKTLDIPNAAGTWLPPIADLYAWAHVEEGEQGTRSRLLSPVKLTPTTSYIAALVPVFESGRRAGLRLADAALAGAALAWEAGTSTLQLPVYDHWTFTTGRADFETLVRRLTPVEAGPDIGYHDMDISRPGGGFDAADLIEEYPDDDDILLSAGGALRSPIAQARKWPKFHEKAFVAKMSDALAPAKSEKEADTRRYDPFTQDPVVSLPRYGTWQKFGSGEPQTQLEDKHWEAEANTDPRQRAHAGLGTKAVRQFQEELMSQAWAVASGQAEIAPYLRQSRTALAVSNRLHRRVRKLPAEMHTQLTRPVQGVVRHGGVPVSQLMDAARAIPAQVMASGFRRATVRAEAMLRHAAPTFASSEPLQASIMATCLGGQSMQIESLIPGQFDGLVDNLAIMFDGVPVSHRMPVEQLEALLAQPSVSAPISAPIGAPAGPLTATASGSVGLRRSVMSPSGARPQSVPIDVRGVVDTLDAELNPDAALTAQVYDRVTGLAPAVGRVPIPPRIEAAFEFPIPAVQLLTRLSPEHLLPGYGSLPADSVSLMALNRRFIEAYMLGLNHEMSREMAWRRFPARLDTTWFRRFWDYAVSDPSRRDIRSISQWSPSSNLGTHDPAPVNARAQTVVMLKSPLFMRYPETSVYLVPAEWRPGAGPSQADIYRAAPATEHRAPILADPSKRQPPIFAGSVGGQGRFFGFTQSVADLRGHLISDAGAPGWFVVFEQARGEATFGLDAPAAGAWPSGAPADIDDLAWSHMAPDPDALVALRHVPLAPDWSGASIDGFEWGADSASMARLTRQAPVRIAIHADAIIAEPV